MQLTITSLDFGPKDLYAQLPIVVDLLRTIPGDDRPDYWLGTVQRPIRWLPRNENHARDVTHLVMAARWTGSAIEPGAQNLPVGMAYVTDQSVLSDAQLDFAKCTYVAIGIVTEVSVRQTPKGAEKTRTSRIAPAFGTGTPEDPPYVREARDLIAALTAHFLMTPFWLILAAGVGESIELPPSSSVFRIALSYALASAVPVLWVVLTVMLVAWWRGNRGPVWSYPLRWGLGLFGTFFTLIALCFRDIRAWFIPPPREREISSSFLP